MYSRPLYQCPHQSGTYVTTDEPPLIYIHHPVATVYLGVHTSCIFFGFGQMCMGYHVSTIMASQSSVMVLEVLCALPAHPSFPPASGNHYAGNVCGALHHTYQALV